MNKKLLIYIATALLAACSSDTTVDSVEKYVPQPIRLGTAMQVTTRSNSQSLQATELAHQATVGVFIYQNTTTTSATTSYGYKNIEYQAQNPDPAVSGVTPGDLTLVTSSDQPYFPEDKSKTLDIYAFSPRTGVYTTTTAELSTLTAQDVFSTKSDQTSDANYLASDFVWGKKAGVTFTQASSTTSRIEIPLEHMLSKVNVNIAPGTGMEGSSTDKLSKLHGVKVTLNKVKLDGTVNFTTGAVTVRADNAGTSYTNTPTGVVLTSATDKTKKTTFTDGGTPATTYDACTCSAIIIPQTLAKGTDSDPFLEISIPNGTSTPSIYKVLLTSDITLDAKKVYTFNIIVNAQSLSLTTTITDWAAGTTVTGTAE